MNIIPQICYFWVYFANHAQKKLKNLILLNLLWKWCTDNILWCGWITKTFCLVKEARHKKPPTVQFQLYVLCRVDEIETEHQLLLFQELEGRKNGSDCLTGPWFSLRMIVMFWKSVEVVVAQTVNGLNTTNLFTFNSIYYGFHLN